MTEPQSNILFLFPDQLRADFLGCYGASFARTPNIDSLCEGGTRFERCVSPSPLCVPARASLLTGYNALKNGVINNNAWLRPDHDQCGMETWPARLSSVGYHTEAIGKMHFYPWDILEGFDHRVISDDKRHIYLNDDYARYLASFGLRKYHGIDHPGYIEGKGAMISIIPAEHQVDKWVADQTINFLDSYSNDKPFALMVGFPGPHCPYDPPEEYARLFDPAQMPPSLPETEDSMAFRPALIAAHKREWNQIDYSDFNESQKRLIRAYYSALIYQIDLQVGRILAALDRNKLLEKTVIIFSSDHGDFLGDYNLIGKSYFYEPSIHVPLIVRDPSKSSSQTIKQVVSLTDIQSTILALAGLGPQSNSDSIPLPDYPGTQSRSYVFGASAMGVMVTNQYWKLCRYQTGQTTLFDLTNDPDELVNRAYDPNFLSIQRELDTILQMELLQSGVFSHQANIIPETGYIGRGDFGQPGWKRTYPHKIYR